MKKTLYEILELQITATEEEIKQAFRNMAKRYHPDTNLENEEASKERMQEITEAYTILSDPKKRQEYDNQLKKEGKLVVDEMKMEYIDPTFNIENNPHFDHIDGLKDISDYLDFAISSTIHKQIPNVTYEQEKKYAKIILKNYINGDLKAFTSTYGIRNNISRIGPEKIKMLFIKILIEQGEFNRRVLRKLAPQNIEDECIDYITNIVYYGQLSSSQEIINSNILTMIDIYVNYCYGISPEGKDHKEQLCYGNNMTIKALEQLNLEMSLNRLKK